jgi:hypothetical protein
MRSEVFSHTLSKTVSAQFFAKGFGKQEGKAMTIQTIKKRSSELALNAIRYVADSFIAMSAGPSSVPYLVALARLRSPVTHSISF